MRNSTYLSDKFFDMMHTEDVSTVVRLHILKNITSSNLFIGTYDDIAKATGFSAISVKRAISSIRNSRDLNGNPFLIRTRQATYMVSPDLVVRADVAEYEEMQMREEWRKLLKTDTISKKAV